MGRSFLKGHGTGKTQIFTVRFTPDTMAKLEAYQMRLSREVGTAMSRADALQHIVNLLGSEHYDEGDHARAREYIEAQEGVKEQLDGAAARLTKPEAALSTTLKSIQRDSLLEFDDMEAEMLWAVQRHMELHGGPPDAPTLVAKQSEPYVHDKRDYQGARQARHAAIEQLVKRKLLLMKGKCVGVTKLGQVALKKLGWK